MITLRSSLILGLACMTLWACNEGENIAQEQTGTETVFNSERFNLWPQGGFFQDESFLAGITADPERLLQENILFVVDRSSSMTNGECPGVDKAATTVSVLKQFIPTLPETVALGYAEFAGGYDLRVPLGLNNRADLLAAVDAYDPSGSSTNLGKAMYYGVEELAKQAMVQNSLGSYRIVFITDGGASDASRLRKMLGATSDVPVEVYTAGFCMENHMLNDPAETVYVNATDPSKLGDLLLAASKVEAAGFVGFAATATK